MNYQIKAILWKNFRLLMKSKSEIIKELAIPFISFFLVQMSCIYLFLKILHQEYSGKDNFSIFELILPIYIPSSFGGIGRKCIMELVIEKTDQYRNLQFVMGMKRKHYRIGWLLTYYIKSAIVMLIIGISFFSIKSIDITDLSLIFFGFLLFNIGFVNQTFFISSFFQHPSLAADVGSLILTLQSFFYFSIFFIQNRNFMVYILICLSPQCAFSMLLMSVLSKQESFITTEFSKFGLISLLIFDIALYLFLHLYMEDFKETRFNRIFKKVKQYINEDMRTIPSGIELIDLEQSQLQQNEIAISISQLNKSYNGKKALDKLNLDIQKNNIFCLLGHNGAGKSTLLNIITKLIKKDSGSVYINGKNFEFDDDISNTLGYCPQNDVLYDKFSVYEQLKFIAMIRNIEKKDINQNIVKICQQIGLSQYIGSSIDTLSGGNKRKLSIAVAAIGQSNILFLDEPTSSIDPFSRRQVWDIIVGLKRQQKTVILTTHFLDEAELLSDDIAIVRKGQILVQGSPSQIKTFMNSGYEMQIFEKPKDIANINKILYEYPNLKKIQEGDELLVIEIPIDYQDQMLNIMQFLDDNGYKFQIKQKSLEDIYMGLNEDEQEDKQNHQAIQISSTQSQMEKFRVKILVMQFYGLLQRRILILLRNFNLNCMISISLLMLLAGACIGGEYLIQMKNKNFQIFFISLIIIQAYAVNSSFYIFLPLFEREMKIRFNKFKLFLRQQIKLLKCGSQLYWIVNYLFDVFCHSFLAAFIFILLQMEYFDFLTDHEKLDYMSILIYFSFSSVGFSYVCSFFFESSTSAFKIYPVINILLSYSVPQILFDTIFPNSIFRKFMIIISPYYTLDLALTKKFEYNFHMIFALQALFFYILNYQLDKNLVCFKNRKPLFKQQNNNVIEVTNLSHKFNGKYALNNINLNVPSNQIFGLLGENGAGKSTLIHLITDIKRIQYGNINSIEDIVISVCQQQDCLWEDLKPQEILSIYSKIKGMKQNSNTQNKINNLLNLLGVNVNKPIRTLSGGQKRKVAVAVALCGEAQLILLDEPSLGLDPISRKSLLGLIKNQVDEIHCGVILTTHHMEEAEKLCNEISVISQGSFLISGKTKDLVNSFEQSKNRIDLILIAHYIIQLKIGMVYEREECLNEIRKALQVSGDLPEDQFGRVTVQKEKSIERYSTLFKNLIKLKYQNWIIEFVIKQATVEDIFLNYTQNNQTIQQ